MNYSRAVFTTALYLAPKLYVCFNGTSEQINFIKDAIFSSLLSFVAGAYNGIISNNKPADYNLPVHMPKHYLAIKFLMGASLGLNIISNVFASDDFSNDLYRNNFHFGSAVNKGFWYGTVITTDISFAFAIGLALSKVKFKTLHSVIKSIANELNQVDISACLATAFGFGLKNYIWHYDGATKPFLSGMASTIACYITNDLMYNLLSSVMNASYELPSTLEQWFNRLFYKSMQASYNGFFYSGVAHLLDFGPFSENAFITELLGAAAIEAVEESMDAINATTSWSSSLYSRLFPKKEEPKMIKTD